MGNTCTPVADACWCMAKPIQYCKLKKKKNLSVKIPWTREPGNDSPPLGPQALICRFPHGYLALLPFLEILPGWASRACSLSAFRTLPSPTLSWQLKPDGIALSGSAHRFCWAARYTSEENFLVLKPSIYRRLCSSLQGQLCNLSVFNPAILPLGIHPPELKAPI